MSKKASLSINIISLFNAILLFIVLLLLIEVILLSGCAAAGAPQDFGDLEIAESMELEYANQFSVDYLTGGCALIVIQESGRFLLVPQGQEPPLNIDKDITVLRQPVENIYLAATSAMCLFDALDALGHISMSGTNADGWYVENARAAMNRGEIVYAGKYSAPDFEMLMAKNCNLAIESTMINQQPEVREKLESLGIPVMMERSSYETHPLGRTEWIKLYGLLCGKDDSAGKLFDEQAAFLSDINAKNAVNAGNTENTENTGKTVAFFYISSTGNAVARKSGDYAVKMIELAGGKYVFDDIGGGDAATGSVNLEMERFYAGAKDADIIIYNSSIDGEVRSIAELLDKSRLLADFKAVKNGDVWCTNKNLFQETTGSGLMISDMNRIFTGDLGDTTQLNYLYKLY